MNWKQEAIALLENYTLMESAAKNLRAQIRLLEQTAHSYNLPLSEAGCVRSNGNREEWLLNNLTKRQKMQARLEYALGWLRVADRGLAVLSAEERQLLQALFMTSGKGTVERLCDTLGVERSSIYRKRDRALERFILALYGIPEKGGQE